ncbi:hypothetical protein TEA_027906 [Camellia sinensis var. sinensis]|uniref:non-specific serine/threonine protein kinase n=1 Tax=Camellia sinensis var. sinensis TaxID=542762 RepID=A0A4V3WL62_CAMSN|nr:hypothetical protein TEA_027906 [Camellia sinensis var. sinensis]
MVVFLASFRTSTCLPLHSNSPISSLISAYSVALRKGNNSITILALATNRVVKLLLFTLIFLSTLIKILNSSKGKREDFINEVGIIGRIHHINVVRLVKYRADGFKRALIYKFLPNDSLEKFVSSGREKGLLGWKKLQDIALGIAKRNEYLHQGCDQRILHFDIKPHNILLDHNLNPKISNFGQVKLCSKERRGKKDFDVTVQNTNQVYFPEWIYNRLHHKEEMGIQLMDDADTKIAKKLAIVGTLLHSVVPDRSTLHECCG